MDQDKTGRPIAPDAYDSTAEPYRPEWPEGAPDPAETAVIKTDMPRRNPGEFAPAGQPTVRRFDPGTARVTWDQTPERPFHEAGPPPNRLEFKRTPDGWSGQAAPRHPYEDPPRVHPYVAPGVWNVVPAVPSSTVSVWAMVLGIVGVFGGWCLFGLPNLAAIILGHVGLADTKDGRKTGRGMAITGLVTGYVMILPAIILFFYMIVGAAAAPFAPTPTGTP